MNHQVTRQILWNVPIAFIVMMYALLFVLLCVFVWRGIYWWRRVALGTAEESRVDQLLGRLWIALRDGAGEGTVVKETWGWMHNTFYVAFVGLFIGTSIWTSPRSSQDRQGSDNSALRESFWIETSRCPERLSAAVTLNGTQKPGGFAGSSSRRLSPRCSSKATCTMRREMNRNTSLRVTRPTMWQSTKGQH